MIISITYLVNDIEDVMQNPLHRRLYLELIPMDLENSSAIIDYARDLNSSHVYAGLQSQNATLGASQKLFYNVTKSSAAPALLNWFSNIIASQGNGSKLISVSNAPLPSDRIQTPFAFASIFFIATGIAVTIPMHAATDMVKDRYFKTRNQLRIMGVGVKTYWSAVFTWDFLCACFIMIIAFVAIKAFNVPIIANGSYFHLFVLFYILYMPMLILFGYSTFVAM